MSEKVYGIKDNKCLVEVSPKESYRDILSCDVLLPANEEVSSTDYATIRKCNKLKVSLEGLESPYEEVVLEKEPFEDVWVKSFDASPIHYVYKASVSTASSPGGTEYKLLVEGYQYDDRMGSSSALREILLRKVSCLIE